MKYFPATMIVLFLIAFHAQSEPAAANGDSQKWEQLMSRSAEIMRDDVAESIRLCDEAGTVALQFGPHDTHFSRTQVLRAQIYLWEKKNQLAEQTFKLAIASCEHATTAGSIRRR